MCSYGDNESAMWSERTRRARKPNQCDECSLPIPRGVIYVYVFGVTTDGDGFTYRYHTECGALAAELGELLCGGQYLVGQLSEHLEEAGLVVDFTTGAAAVSEEKRVEAFRNLQQAIADRERLSRVVKPGEEWKLGQWNNRVTEAQKRVDLDPWELLRRWEAIHARYGSAHIAELGGEGG